MKPPPIYTVGVNPGPANPLAEARRICADCGHELYTPEAGTVRTWVGPLRLVPDHHDELEYQTYCGTCFFHLESVTPVMDTMWLVPDDTV